MPLTLEAKNPSDLDTETSREKQRKIKREIVAEPVDAFYNPDYYYTGLEDYTPEEIEEIYQEMGNYPYESEEEQLDYSPFNPEAELEKIRKFSKKEELLSFKEKSKLQQERLRSYKEKLDKQKKGIATTIKEIKDIMQSNPDIKEEELLSHLKKRSKKYRFTEHQVNNFQYAISEYCKKHQAVEKYKQEFPNDNNFFKACFQKEPEGKIEVQKFPMCLLLRCYDFRDFITAYTYNADEKTKKELLEKANEVAGCALSKVGIDKLSDTVIIENVRNNGSHEFDHHIEKHEKLISKNKSVELSIGSIYNDLEIEVLDSGKWKLKVAKDSHNNPAQIELVNLNDKQLVFDVTIHEPPPESKYFLPVFRKKGDHPNALNRANVWERLGKYDKTALINLNGYFIEIENRSPQGTKVSYSTEEFIRFVPSLEYSKKTAIHEIEHQVNKLFVPTEIRQATHQILRDTIRQYQKENPEKLIDELIRRLVRFERNYLLDKNARDEILAFYSEGYTLDNIYETLSESPLYDYSKQSYYRQKIEKMPEDIQNFIKENTSEFIYEVEEKTKENQEKRTEGKEETVEENLVFIDAKELQVNEELVRKFIKIVFEKEYKEELKKWLDSIALMEKKGYTKDEISDLLYQEPVSRWPNFVKRIGFKSKK